MTRTHFHEGDLIGVLTTQPIGRVLDYKAPEGGCFLGAFVEVPLGPRKVMGVVWAEGQGDFDHAKIRPVTRVLDVAPMAEEMRVFIDRAAAYTLTPLPAMLRLATRAPGLGDAPSMRKVYRLGGREPDRMTDARRKVMEVLRDYGGLSFTLGEVAEMAGVGTSVVKGLVKQGAVAEEDAPRDTPYPRLDPDYGGKALSEDQTQAAEVLRGAIGSGQYGTTLLKGVTGSGKTEVYLEAVAACLRAGRQALVLLPEIALTGEFIDRVEARFGMKPAEWHSGVTMTERRRCWKMVGQGDAQLVVGARSALFLPYRDLGLIVVDEEHDTSYKQEDGVLYNARDMAVLRAAGCAAQVVLASATPSLESWANVEAGKYRRLNLTSRFGAAVMPSMGAIDMRNEDLPGGKWVSPTLRDAIAQRLEKGEQSLMVLSSDLYGSARAMKAHIEEIAQGGTDIIIGTQLVAKGHNFPNLTLVGVIDADLGLQGSDLRAAERTFQLMRQVAGRAGRAEVPGEALLQTYQPEHPVIRAILGGDEEAFWAAEAAERKAAGVPPYGRMAGIVLSSPNVQEVFDLGGEMARRDAPLRRIGAQVFGPAPAPIARIRGRHRVRLLVKADKGVPLQQALTEWVGQFRLPTNLRLAIDIDPQSFY
ncbi:MAG: primosomal protein N' [Loktanella sp.]|nr:primosomal protein N' [Loktanella sp.]